MFFVLREMSPRGSGGRGSLRGPEWGGEGESCLEEDRGSPEEVAGVGEVAAVDRQGAGSKAEAHVSPGWVPQSPLVLSRGYLLTSHSPHPALQAPQMVSHSPPGLSPL